MVYSPPFYDSFFFEVSKSCIYEKIKTKYYNLRIITSFKKLKFGSPGTGVKSCILFQLLLNIVRLAFLNCSFNKS